MLQTLYARILALSASDRAPLWLALVAFAEGSGILLLKFV